MAAVFMNLRWLAAVAAVLLLPAAAMAQAWTVGPGGDYDDLEEALYWVPEGHAVLVLEGDYEGNFERLGSLELRIGTDSKARIVGRSPLHPVLYMDGDELFVVVEAQGEIFAPGTADEVRTYGLLAEADTIEVVNKGKIEASVSGLKDVWVYGMLLEGETEVAALNEGRIVVTAVLSEDAWDGRKRVVGLAAHGTGPDTQIEVTNNDEIDVWLNSDARAFITRLAGVEMEGSLLALENTGDVKVKGEIKSDGLNPSASLAAGVLLDGSKSITVNNSGTILFDFTNDQVFSTGEVAAMRVAGGHPVSGLTAQVEVTNAGEITNKASSFGTLDVHGVSIWGKDVTFVNKNGGKIAANHHFQLSGLIVSHGVQINRNARQPGSSTVENHGEIQVDLVTGEGYRATGMHIEASDLEMVNTGSISVGAWAKPELPSTDLHWATGADLYIQKTATITNEGTIEVKAESDHGIPDAYGLRLNGTSTGSSVEIDNGDTGLIAAWVGSARAIAIDATAFQGTVKLANHGQLVGDVLLGDGNSEVELHPGSAVEGHVFLGGGTNTARVWSGALPGLTGALHGGQDYNILIVELDPSGGMGLGEVHDLTGKMNNFQEAHLKSGQWRLDETNLGNMRTYVGEDAGLVIHDTLVLGPNGLLGGHGTIAGSVDSGLGIVSPGLETASSGPGTVFVDGSIGTLTADTYTHSPGSTYVVETLADGSSDQVAFTGVATLNGGRLQIVPLDHDGVDAYRGKTVDYTILTASSIVERPDGTLFDEVDAPVLLKASLHTEGNGGSDHLKLTLTTRSIGDLARTDTEHVVAAVLDQIYDADPGSELIGPFKTMRSQSVARQRLNSLTGEIYTAYPVLSVVGIDRFAGAVLQGMAAPTAADGRRGWVAPYGTTGKLKGDDDNAGADVKMVGGAAGMHVLTGPNGMVGITAGFGHGTLDMGARHSKMTGDGYQMGVYGQYDVGMVRMTGLFVHARTRYDAQRGITGATGSVDRTAHGRFDGTQLLASLRGEVLRIHSGGVAVEPVFGLSWLRLSRNGFSEEGAGDANLQVNHYSASYLRGDVGLRINMQPTTTRGGWTLNPSLRAAYIHDFSAPSRDITVRLQGAPDQPLHVQGIKHATSGFRAGLGLNAMRGDARFGWDLHYEGEFRSDVQVHSIHGGLAFQF